MNGAHTQYYFFFITAFTGSHRRWPGGGADLFEGFVPLRQRPNTPNRQPQ
jgi:hypothetical protein